jgi:hypothetical protein
MRLSVWRVVASELRSQGLSGELLPRADDLELPGSLPALAEGALSARSACWEEGTHRLQVRLQCQELAQCLPFIVYLHPAAKTDKTEAKVEAKLEDEGSRPANLRSADEIGSCGNNTELQRLPFSSQPAPAKPHTKPLILAGDRATAVFITAGLRLSASVTCLERGRQDDVIRVRNQNGQIFRARISGAGLLEVLE